MENPLSEGLPVPLTGAMQWQPIPSSAQRFLFIESRLRQLARIVRDRGGVDAFVYDCLLSGCTEKKHFTSTFARSVVVVALDALDAMEHVEGKGLDRLANRFWKFVNTTEHPDGCWRWDGAHDPKTHRGLFYKNGSNVSAHRVAWELTAGHAPLGEKQIERMCRTPDCVNPDHFKMRGLDNRSKKIRSNKELEDLFEYDTTGKYTPRYCKNGHPLMPGQLKNNCGKCRTSRYQKQKDKLMKDYYGYEPEAINSPSPDTGTDNPEPASNFQAYNHSESMRQLEALFTNTATPEE